MVVQIQVNKAANTLRRAERAIRLGATEVGSGTLVTTAAILQHFSGPLISSGVVLTIGGIFAIAKGISWEKSVSKPPAPLRV